MGHRSADRSMSDTVTIRPAAEHEVSVVLAFIRELARYERLIRIACLYSENRTAEAERERAALDLH